MLDPDRERRLKINDIMKNDWITVSRLKRTAKNKKKRH